MSSSATSRISTSCARSPARTSSRRSSRAAPITAPTVRGFWWGLASGAHTADRALAQLPRYFRSRMDELGIDFAHCYTTRGLSHVYLPDEAARRASCRALNMLYAEMFADVRDRLRPVAVIPTYTPQEAIEELEFAVNELGHKAVMIGTELRGPGTARDRQGSLPVADTVDALDRDGFALRLRSVLAQMHRAQGHAGLPHLLARHRLPRFAEQLRLQPSRRLRQRRRILLPLADLQRRDPAFSEAELRLPRRRRRLGRQPLERHRRALGEAQRRGVGEEPRSQPSRRRPAGTAFPRFRQSAPCPRAHPRQPAWQLHDRAARSLRRVRRLRLDRARASCANFSSSPSISAARPTTAWSRSPSTAASIPWARR